MEVKEIYQQTVRYFLRPVLSLLEDPAVSEILINGHDQIYFERAGKLEKSDLKFPDASALSAAIQNIAEYVARQVNSDHHSMDARLPDGSRVHVIIPPSSRNGAHVSIRKFKKRGDLTLDSLVAWGSLSAAAAEFLSLSVLLHKNIIISGGTGTGKTSLLNALSASIPDSERIIVIEDSAELQMLQPHTVYLEAQQARPDGLGQVTIRDLFVDSLRMRPDRIIVGEVRRGEALDLIQSMLSGHSGALATVHATTPRDALVRLETLCLLAGVDLPVQVSRKQTASAINLVVQIGRLMDGSRRVMEISEVRGLDDAQNYRVRSIFKYKFTGRNPGGTLNGSLETTGKKPSYHREPLEMGLEDKVLLCNKLFSVA